MDYLTEHTSYRFELKLSRDYTEAVKLMRTGVTPIASLGDVTFIEAFHAFAATPILRPLNKDGKPYYRSIIIVAENSSIQSLDDLRGKSFAFGDSHSTSGNLIPRNYLFRHGITLFDFERYDNLDSHDAVVKAVLKGKFDAGAVKDVLARHYQSHGLRFLASSDPIPSVPIVVRPDAPEQLIREVKQALLAIDATDPAMAARMESWDPEFRHGFVPASLDDYQNIIEMMDSIRLGCGVRCH
jgi:phosphonate transport system substrate-binding protein